MSQDHGQNRPEKPAAGGTRPDGTRPDGTRRESQIGMGEGGLPIGLFLFLILVLGLGIWQFGTLNPSLDFPSESVDALFEGKSIVLYNPTNSVLDATVVTVMRLSGTYRITERNIRPRSVRKIPLRRLRTEDGRRYDPTEEGECRLRLQWWFGSEPHEFSRFCREY